MVRFRPWSGAPSLVKPALAFGLALTMREVLRRRNLMDLRGRVVMITGGSRGLGLLLAEEFGRQGARVVICARNREPLERARRRLEGQGVEVLAVPCDVADRQQVEYLVAAARTRFGQIDVLVNNAGIITVGPLRAQTLTDFEESMGVMFWGPVYATLAVLPEMRARREGWIVNITSIDGRVSTPHLLPYNCAKFAALGLSEGLRAELSRYGIRVVTVVPGLMRTGSHVNALFKGRHRTEFTLFSLLGALPVVSISAQSAVRQIVTAVRRGDSETVLGPVTELGVRFHGLFPGSTANLLALIGRVLPESDGSGTQPRTGKESRTAISNSFLTADIERAAQRLNQYEPAAGPVSPAAR